MKTKILSKPLDSFVASIADGDTSWTTFSSGYWNVYSNTTNNCRAFTDAQIDLGGLTRQEKTVFFKNLELQMPYPPSMLSAIAGDNLQLTLIIQDQPIDDFDIYGAGLAYSNTNAENLLLYRTQTWLCDQDTAQWGSVLKLANETAMGLMRATASDTLYIRYYVTIGTLRVGPGPVLSSLEKFSVPPLMIVAEVDVDTEAEYQYIMRLRRAFELAQTDRD